jgi:nucleotide-binding universal stress UspA family protein
MYESILVAYDGSEFSKAALKEASSWVKRHGGRITLLHAVYFDEEEFSIASDQHGKRVDIGKSMCQEARGVALSEYGVEVDSLVCEGEPPEVIAKVAREKGADLIAMGTYGKKGLKRLIMGSVTSAVVLKAPCDVLVVKRPCSECNGRYGSLLIPYDGSEFSKKALRRAFEFEKLDDGRATALYVIPRYEEMVGFIRSESISRALHREAQKITDSAKELAAANSVSLETVVEEGHAADRIVETAARINNDLIIMGSYGMRGVDRAIMGSTAERVIMNAPCPLLIVRQ